MGMKGFDQKRVTTAEVSQLLLLYSIFSLKGSENIAFQGGTAIRWAYGGMRFSEDLDFVAKEIDIDEIAGMMKRAYAETRNHMIANFGPGEFDIIEKKSRESAHKAFITFKPHNMREKVAVKIEFEKLKKGVPLGQRRVLLGGLPGVLFLIQQGVLKVPVIGGVANVETEEEILTDKVRALLERRYIKGRDAFDIWFLTDVLNTKLNEEALRRKLDAYEAPFIPFRDVGFFIDIDTRRSSEVVTEIDRDLSRFLVPDQLRALRETNYRDIVLSVRRLFSEIRRNGIIDTARYGSSQRRRTKGAVR